MKHLLIFLMCVSLCWGATYYVDADADGGGDGNEGTEWNSLSQVWTGDNSGSGYNGGDQILFQRGDTFEDSRVKIISSGDAGDPIIFGAYGTGADPILRFPPTVEDSGDTDWNNDPSVWTNTGSNIWTMPTSSNDNIKRLFINGSEKAPDVDATVDATDMWYFDDAADKLYLYSTQEPRLEYTSLEWGGWTAFWDMNTTQNITFQNLDIRGGTVCLQWDKRDATSANGTNIIVENCSIGRYSSEGILIRTDKSSVTGTIIRNNTFDADWGGDAFAAENNCQIQDGIRLRGGNGFLIHDNTFIDWSHAGVYITGTTPATTNNNLVYNNEFYTDSPVSYSRAFTFDNGSAGYTATGNKFYNNYVHDVTVRSQVASTDSEVYYNIFANVTRSGVLTADGGAAEVNLAEGLSIETYTGAMDGVKCYNNVFYNIAEYGIRVYDNTANITNTEIKNNVLYNCGEDPLTTGALYDNVGIQIENDAGVSSTVLDNNLYYTTTGTDAINYRGTGYTMSQLNGASLSQSDTAADNLQSDPLFFDASSNNFKLTSTSPCINTGVDVGLQTDYVGNAIEGLPDIGAYEFIFGSGGPTYGTIFNIPTYTSSYTNLYGD